MDATTESNETKNGNNGEGRLAPLKGKRYSKKDFMELSLLCAYIVQRRGGATHGDVLEVFTTEMASKVHPSTLSNVLEALRAKDILAAIHNADGERSYQMKRLQFNCNVEIAHLTRMIPKLEEDPSGVAIIALVEGAEGKVKEEDRYPQAWADYTVQFRLIEPWYGGTPVAGNKYLLSCLESSPYRVKGLDLGKLDPKAYPLFFGRNPLDGALVVHRACVKGFVSGCLRSIGVTPWSIDNWHFRAIMIKPKIPLTTYLSPVQRDNNFSKGGGAGLQDYELVNPGEEITWHFAAPTKNYISPANMERFIRRILRTSPRSMSPARGSQTGEAELVSIEHSLWDWDES